MANTLKVTLSKSIVNIDQYLNEFFTKLTKLAPNCRARIYANLNIGVNGTIFETSTQRFNSNQFDVMLQQFKSKLDNYGTYPDIQLIQIQVVDLSDNESLLINDEVNRLNEILGNKPTNMSNELFSIINDIRASSIRFSQNVSLEETLKSYEKIGTNINNKIHNHFLNRAKGKLIIKAIKTSGRNKRAINKVITRKFRYQQK